MINRINYSSEHPSFRIPFTTSRQVKDMFLYIQNAGIVYTRDDYSVHRKNFDSTLFCYIFKGEGTLIYRDAKYRLNAGSLFIIDCMEEHLYKSSTKNPLRLMFVHCNGPNSRQYTQAILDFHKCLFHLEKHSPIKKLIGSSISILSSGISNKEILCSQKLNTLYTELLLLSKTRFSQIDPLPDFIRDCMNYLEINYKNRISLELLSQRFAISKYHFLRQFKHYTGSTPYEYLMNCRLNKAKQYLINSDKTISEIVFLSGFRDHSNFARYFKTHEGTTPNNYRLMYRT